MDNQPLGLWTIQLQSAWAYSASQASNGNLALLVDFGLPSQGIVLSESGTHTLIARGCYPSGGCGDPTPIGGTFGSMYISGQLVPDVNSRGDVVFAANVEGGSSSQALFFYEHSTQTIQKIAAVGDPTPTGGSFGAIGIGSINDAGDVVFLAYKTSYLDGMILRWKSGGPLVKVVAPGDQAPNGGTFQNVIFLLIGQLPAWPPIMCEDGRVVFLANKAHSTGGFARGIYEEHNGQMACLVFSQDPAPGGGHFDGFWPPIPNDQGEVAFVAKQVQGPGASPYVWFRGRPGQWERVVGSSDTINGQTITGMGGSASPFSGFDDAGNLLVPFKLRDPITSVEKQALILCRPGLEPEILLQVGDPSPLGPITQLPIGQVCMTPNSVAVVGMEVMTASGPVDAHMLIDICVPPDTTTYCTAKVNSAGCLPRIAAIGIPSASAQAGFVVQADRVLNLKSGLLFYGVSGKASTPFAGGTLCVKAPVKRAVPVSSGGSPPPSVDCSGLYRLDLNAFASGQLGGSPASGLSVPGTTVYCQWYGRDPGYPQPANVQLSDAVEYRVVP